MSPIEIIAMTIGHHFWECKDDDDAIKAGKDVARKVLDNLESQQPTSKER